MKNEIIEKIFAQNNDEKSVLITWENFITHALYDDKFGYYKRDKKRVGGNESDFYTASSLKRKVFSELITESAKTILSNANVDFFNYQFLEIGAEPERQIIDNSMVIRLGEEIKIPQQAIVISNELLDARPFARFKFDCGKWKKRILKISKTTTDYEFSEELSDATEEEIEHLYRYFPYAKVEGFSIDVSFDVLKMFDTICAQDWQGILIFADYFRTARELSELPRGTARSYFKHKDSSNLTQNIGLSDITFSPCSDTLLDIAKEHAFTEVRVDSQLNFFMNFATKKIQEIIEAREKYNFKKRELAELINPVNMGEAFRVLSAHRL